MRRPGTLVFKCEEKPWRRGFTLSHLHSKRIAQAAVGKNKLYCRNDRRRVPIRRLFELILGGHHGDLDQRGRNEGSDKWSNSGFILPVRLMSRINNQRREFFF